MNSRAVTNSLRAAAVATMVASQLFVFSPSDPGSSVSASVTDPTWAWIQSQLRTDTVVTTTSTITADQAYEPGWTGPVSGVFDLQDVPTPPVLPTTPIELDAPLPTDPAARPVVHGQVTLPASASRWIIDVQRQSANGLVSAQLQTLAGADGTFTLDLARAADGQGAWSFRVLDAESGYAQTGDPWPSPGTYDGLEVQAIVVTDTAYPIGSAPARADGTFAFASSQPGAKVFRLVEVATGNILAEESPETGLVRSFEVADASPLYGRTFAYDQALALLAAQAVDDQPSSRALAAGLIAMQTATGPQQGAFVSSASSLNPSAARAEYRTGISSIATYAILSYLRELNPADADYSDVRQAATRGVDWLMIQQIHSGGRAGLVGAGYGVEDVAAGTFDPSAVVDWISTEHNLDAWHTLTLAASVLPSPAAATAADELEDAVLTMLWDDDRGAFLQGLNGSGADATEVLDVNSWGAVFLDLAGHGDKAVRALSHTSIFESQDGGVVGHGPRLPGPAPLVWAEGSAGVALAEHRLGDTSSAQATLDGLDLATLASGAYRAATRDEPQWDMIDVPAVGGSAWVVLVRRELAGQTSVWGPVGPEGESSP
ncbi:MAG: hypothetical protein WA912_01380 [Ornithinimicrobium sp.]